MRELNSLKKDYYEGEFEEVMMLARKQTRCAALADRSSEPKRKRSIAQVEEQMLDSDYEEFLSLLPLSDASEGYLDPLSMDGGNAADDSLDPAYMNFLKSLKGYGRSYGLEIFGKDGKMKVIKYESPMKKWSESKKNVKVEAPDPVFSRTCRRSHNLEDRPQKMSVMMEKKKANEKAAKGSTKGPPPHLDVPMFVERGARSYVIDKEYEQLLQGLKIDGGKCIYTSTNGSGREVKFYVAHDRLLDVKVKKEPRDVTPFPAFANNKVDPEKGRGETPGTDHAMFKEGLMKDINRPYDKEEYKKLKKEAYLRKPVYRDKNLRGTIKSCLIEGEFGQSYMDQYIVVARKIDAAKGDRPRILNLLRGFFYWLKNLAQEGAFCPWLDRSCLDVLPPIDKKRKSSQLEKEIKLPQHNKRWKLGHNYK